MSDFYNTAYNPDVLSCIANLSNDEVFTPPEIANKMLDMLPAAPPSVPFSRRQSGTESMVLRFAAITDR